MYFSYIGNKLSTIWSYFFFFMFATVEDKGRVSIVMSPYIVKYKKLQMAKCYKCKKNKDLSLFPSGACWWCSECIEDYLDVYLENFIPISYLWSCFRASRPEIFISKEQLSHIYEIVKPRIIKFIEENPGCQNKHIVEKFETEIRSKYLYSALNELKTSGEIQVVGRRPMRYFIKGYKNPSLSKTPLEDPPVV